MFKKIKLWHFILLVFAMILCSNVGNIYARIQNTSVFTAEDISFDESTNPLTKDNVQEAIEELTWEPVNTFVDVNPMLPWKTYYVDASTTPITMTLPDVSASTHGQKFQVILSENSNDITINTVSGTDLIGDFTQQSISIHGDAITFQANNNIGKYEMTQDSRPKTPSSAITFYGLAEASGISTYNWNVTNTSDPDYSTSTPVNASTGLITGSNQLVASFISKQGAIQGLLPSTNITSIALIRKVSGGADANAYVNYYKRTAGGTETLMGTSNTSQTVTNTSFEELSVNGITSVTEFTATDYFVVKLFGNKVGAATDPVYEVQLEGINPARTIVPIPASIQAHFTIAGIQLAGNGVYDGHVDDQTQSIFGNKNFNDYIAIGSTTNTSSLVIEGTAGVNVVNIASSTGSSLFLVSNKGNIGIGSTTPNWKLSVNGDGYFTGDLYANGELVGGNGGSTYTGTAGEIINGATEPVAVSIVNSSASADLESGSSQYFSISDASQTGLDLNSDYTIELWFKPETLGVNQMLIDKENFGGSIYGYYLRLNSSNQLEVLFRDSGGNTTQFTQTTASITSTGTWYHIAVSVDISAPSGLIYINSSSVGVTNSLTNATTINNNAEPFRVGVRNNSGLVEYLDGKIDDLRIWSDIRTGTEITNNYQTQLNGNEENLELYARFNLVSDDLTSNNNNLANSGGIVYDSADVPFSQDTFVILKSDANDSPKLGFIGFATTNATIGNSITVQINGYVPNFTGLTTGDLYYVQDTAGTIGTIPGTNTILVGRALSATEILINNNDPL